MTDCVDKVQCPPVVYDISGAGAGADSGIASGRKSARERVRRNRDRIWVCQRRQLVTTSAEVEKRVTGHPPLPT